MCSPGPRCSPVSSAAFSYAADHRLSALHDCVLLLHAQKLGLTPLTANVADFDILLQLVRSGRILFYRAEQRR